MYILIHDPRFTGPPHPMVMVPPALPCGLRMGWLSLGLLWILSGKPQSQDERSYVAKLRCADSDNAATAVPHRPWKQEKKPTL